MPRKVPLIHPGVILLEDWLKPIGISLYALAKAIGVPPRRINEIVKGLRSITVDTALRCAANTTAHGTFIRPSGPPVDQPTGAVARHSDGDQSANLAWRRLSWACCVIESEFCRADYGSSSSTGGASARPLARLASF